MEHREALELLQPYFDDELDLAGSLELERHVADCSECAARLKTWQRLREAVNTPAMYFAAPKALEARVRSMAGEAASRKPLRFWRPLQFAALAAACTLVVILVLRMLPSAPEPGDLLAGELLQSHIRSLMPGHLTDVTSTDQHTVKPWFNGRVDFSPPVMDLSSDGFPLLGGRLDYVDNRPVAALVYQRRRHLINLFVWPTADAAGAPTGPVARQGYHILTWRMAGMTCSAVSDLDAGELGQFAALFQK